MLTTIKYRPVFDFTNDFETEMDKMFKNFFGTDFLRHHYYEHSPMDVIDNKDEITVIAEMPGVKKEDLKISVLNDTLTISYKRNSIEIPESAKWLRSERNFGNFTRTFYLPNEVETDKISAEYKDGILKVSLPKSEEEKPKEISVKIE